MLHFDLRSPVIAPGQSFFMLHPGKNYHLYERFQEFECVSTDLPNLSLRDGSSPTAVRDIDIQIRRARALRDWLALNSSERKKIAYSTDLSDYLDGDNRRFHDSYKETLNNLLWELPEGTPIFVPFPGLAKDGFFCELQPASDERVQFHGPRIAKEFTYAGRAVRNLRHIPMRLIPLDILGEKGRTSILTELDPQQTERLLRLYYGSFSIQGSVNQTEIDVPSDVFRPADSNVINGLANFLEENLQRIENGESEATKFQDAFFLAFEEAELQIHARLDSPGIIQVAAKTVAPFLLAFFLAVPDGLATDDVVKILKNHDVTVSNSSCPQDQGYPRLIEERLFNIIDMIGESDISDVCNRVREVKQRTKANVDATVDVIDDSRKLLD